MQELPGLAAAIAAVGAITGRFATASDAELLADLAGIESLGRMVDALRIDGAAQAQLRSRKALGEQGLAFRSGARDGIDLVQRVARIDRPAAKRRVGLGVAIAPGAALDGAELPGRYPQVRAALRAGAIGQEAARVIAATASAIRARVEPGPVDDMVAALVDTARREDAETVGDVAAMWSLALDPDGSEPREREQRRKRALRLGRTRADGTTGATLVLTPEHLAAVRELLQSRRRGGLTLVEPGSEESGTDLAGEWRETASDARTRAQQDYDTLLDALLAGIRAEHDGIVTTAVTHEVIVQISAAELEARRGQGWAPGVLAGLPVPVVERRICTGGVRLLVTGPRGEALHLSRRQRCFTPAQKKALAAAAGGRCEYPGCRTPAPYLDAHHVRWWLRDGGRTDVANGVMLCSHHHHLVHASGSPVEIRRHRGDLYFVPREWAGPPDPHQRRRSRPAPSGGGGDPDRTWVA